MAGPPLDRAQIQHLAGLTSLSLSDAEAETLAVELRSILAYVEELQAVDTSEVDAVGADASAIAAWRKDVVVAGLSHEDALAAAPRASEAGFAVPGFVSSGAAAGKGTR